MLFNFIIIYQMATTKNNNEDFYKTLTQGIRNEVDKLMDYCEKNDIPFMFQFVMLAKEETKKKAKKWFVIKWVLQDRKVYAAQSFEAHKLIEEGRAIIDDYEWRVLEQDKLNGVAK